MTSHEYGRDTPFPASLAQAPSHSLVSLLTTAWPLLCLVSLSTVIMLLKLSSRLLGLYVSLLLLPFSDWNPISVARGAKRLLVAELLELFIWGIACLRKLIALIILNGGYDPHIVTSELMPTTTTSSPIAAESTPIDSPIAPPRRPRPASYHGRTTKSGGIKPLHLPLKVAGSPRFNSDSPLASPPLGSVDEEILSSFPSRAASRSRRPSDASRAASADNTRFSIDDEGAPTRHRRSASSQTFLSQERASLLFRIEELEQALEEARSKGEVMARTVFQMTRERQDLLQQTALLNSPIGKFAELEDRNLAAHDVGDAPNAEHALASTSNDTTTYPSPPCSPPSPLLLQPGLLSHNHASAFDIDSPSPLPRSSHLVKSLVQDAFQPRPRVVLTSPTLDTTVTAKYDGASGSLYIEANAIGIFTSPIEDGDHFHSDHSV